MHYEVHRAYVERRLDLIYCFGISNLDYSGADMPITPSNLWTTDSLAVNAPIIERGLSPRLPCDNK